MSAFANRFSSISALQADLASGRLSATDLVRATLTHIDHHDSKLHAFVHIMGREALDAALACDRGRKDNGTTGALTGIPVAVKDLFDVAGLPTRAGSAATSTANASTSAFCVQKLVSAGAILVGKTHSVEFAFGGWGTNSVLGTPWNPWDTNTHRVPGGSSSGSAVAVASGMAVAALGTDTGGSVRTPASYCGLVGTKTSSGLISRSGVFPLCPTHDTVGTLTRSVRDAGQMLQVISGPDENDPVTLDAPKLYFLSSLDVGIEGLQLGVLESSELAAADPKILHLYERSLEILQSAGGRIMQHRLPRSLADYLEAGGRLMSAESYSSLSELVEQDDSPVAAEIRERVLGGRSISQSEYAEMLALRKAEQRNFLAGFDGYDALIMPTCSNTAIAVEEVDERAIITPFGRFVNYLDLAAVSVPMGLASDGLPAGLQIVVRKFDDPLALQIAQVIEAAVGTLHPADL